MEYTVLDIKSMTSQNFKPWKSYIPSWVSLEDGVEIQTLNKPSEPFMIVGEILCIITLDNELNQCVLDMREIRQDGTFGKQFVAHIDGHFQTLKPKVFDKVAFMNPFIVVRSKFNSNSVVYNILPCKSPSYSGHIFYFTQKNNLTQSTQTSSDNFSVKCIGERNNQLIKERESKEDSEMCPSTDASSISCVKSACQPIKGKLHDGKCEQHQKNRGEFYKEQNPLFLSPVKSDSQYEDEKHPQKKIEKHEKPQKASRSGNSHCVIRKDNAATEELSKQHDCPLSQHIELTTYERRLSRPSRNVHYKKKKERLETQPSVYPLSVESNSQQVNVQIEAFKNDLHQNTTEDTKQKQSVGYRKEYFRVKSIRPEKRNGDTLDWVSATCVLGCGNIFVCSTLNFEDTIKIVCPFCLREDKQLQLKIVFYVELLVFNTKGKKYNLIFHNEMAEQFFNCSVEEFISNKSLREDKYKMLKRYCTSKASKSIEPPMLSCSVIDISEGILLFWQKCRLKVSNLSEET